MPDQAHGAAVQERDALRLEVEQLRARALATRNDSELLAERTRKLAAVQVLMDDRRREIQDWQQRLAAAEAKMQSLSSLSEQEKSLRQELAVKNKQLVTQGAAVARLEAQSAAWEQARSVVPALEAEVTRLRADNDALRARAVATRPTPRHKPLALNVDGMSRGSVLQSLVERVSGLADIRCSVVADDLGLVVASHGELADELAAVGALFSRAGQQAQQVLSLQNVERVTVEDSLGMVLALRPLSTDRYGDPDLSLITLAVGDGPDQRLVNKLIDESPRAAVSP